MKVLKPNGILVIREPMKNNDALGLITKLKLNGFLLKNTEPETINSESGESIFEISAEKPSYEVNLF